MICQWVGGTWRINSHPAMRQIILFVMGEDIAASAMDSDRKICFDLSVLPALLLFGLLISVVAYIGLQLQIGILASFVSYFY